MTESRLEVYIGLASPSATRTAGFRESFRSAWSVVLCYLSAPMRLACKSVKIGDVVVIRCEGRIVVGEEVQSLLQKIEEWELETKKFVLQLAGVAYVDSGGMGALVRLVGKLRAARGDLKLCELPPFLIQVLETIRLKGLFDTYKTEREAIAAFSHRVPATAHDSHGSRPRVICIDSSSDLLAYLSAMLKRHDFDVYTAKFLSDATTLARSTHPQVAVCGPTTQESTQAFEKFRQANPGMQILILPPDFDAAEAGQAGSNLVERIEGMFGAQG